MTKTLLFKSVNESSKCHNNAIEEITVDNATVSNEIDTSKLRIGNVTIYHGNNDSNLMFAHNISNLLTFKADNCKDSIVISQEGNVFIRNLKTDRDFYAENIICSGNIEANNIDLLEDITVDNIHVNSDIIVGDNMTVKEVQVEKNMEVNGTLNVKKRIITRNIHVKNDLIANSLETEIITSNADLNIIPGINCSVNIPNVRYQIDIYTSPVIDPGAIKSAKIFIINQNTMIETDETCDGYEIIIYNHHKTQTVIVRNFNEIISRLSPSLTARLIYFYLDDKWITV